MQKSVTAHLAKTVAGWPFEKPGGRTLVMLIPLIALIHDDMATWHRRAVLRSATAVRRARLFFSAAGVELRGPEAGRFIRQCLRRGSYG